MVDEIEDEEIEDEEIEDEEIEDEDEAEYTNVGEGKILWEKPSGARVITNTHDDNIKAALGMGWERV